MYETFLVVGDFNSEIKESVVQDFWETYHLHNLIKDSECFKNPDKPLCIDLILINVPK